MASAASTSALPKSKAGASASTKENGRTPATTTSHEPSAHQQAEAELRSSENPDFIHPDHVIPRPNYGGFEDLIIVCCHAIYLPDADENDFPLRSPHNEGNWLLAPFQKSDPETGKPGEHSTFVAHAQAGVNALIVRPDNADLEKNLLAFSGSATKRSVTSMSEARSYYHAALAEELAEGHYGGGRTHQLYSKGRILLEEQATDSFQNLLFSILLFRRTTGSYPRQVRVITHAFKTKRFLELHAPAIRWPENRILVQGIDSVMSSSELDSTLEGEEQFGYAPWDEDPLGTGERLSSKRKQRGWDPSVVERLADGLEDSIKQLLQGIVPERLPWEA
ncbi:hypothetical protein EK21DRAFT_51346 [Setomelanomma holmii]|uniref:DUF218 domain-containing protein n=1 Tax=Setomelanomma holmii TaxID=210430 RepID=A0A9P4LU57_9PLEO|nr:hypothetical protein EK21DRAFT_51346 [Setomelanomma holmii]